MGLITRLKSLLGLGDERSKTHNRDNGVTIEREPTETRAQPSAESERAVKMTEESPNEDTSVSTTELVDEGKPADHIEEAEPDTAAESDTATESEATSEPDTAAEPAEATGPSPEAGQPAQTEATEPEPKPDAVSDGVSTDDVESDESADESMEDIDTEDDTGTETETEDEVEPEPEPEPKSTTESREEGRPLEDVKGIGPAYAERLRNAGIEDSAQLAVADSAELARETDLSAKRIEGWMERAKSM